MICIGKTDDAVIGKREKTLKRPWLYVAIASVLSAHYCQRADAHQHVPTIPVNAHDLMIAFVLFVELPYLCSKLERVYIYITSS